MTDLELQVSPLRAPRTSISAAEIDHVLGLQLSVAWAGEGGEEDKRLGWWRTDMISEFGGEDLFRRLLPNTWRWAVFQAAREAARRKDAELRSKAHDADRVVSLFSLGFEVDERIEERLQDLKRLGAEPTEVLPPLAAAFKPTWKRASFEQWLSGFDKPKVETTPTGRLLKGRPDSYQAQAQQLVAALAPLAADYPLPHFVLGK